MVKKWLALYVAFIALGALALCACGDLGSEDQSDGWQLSTPEAQGFDSSLLSGLLDRIRIGDYGNVHSLLIVRHGCLVIDEYFRGYSRETLHPVYSVTKSVTSALVGIALERGEISRIDQQLLSFFPEYSAIANLDPRKRTITLKDLLTMIAGFEWNESSVPYGDPRNPTYQLAESSDWMKFMLDRPITDEPGAKFRYNSGCSMLLSGILQNVTGMSSQQYAERNLFQYLGIARTQWETGPRGISNTGWGLHMRPRDMAKLGFLYLRAGVWEQKRIISSDWIRQSVTSHVTVNRPLSYGFQWWLLPIDTVTYNSAQPNEIQFAWGWGDQFIFVVPAFDMVVVSTAGNFSPPDDQALIFLREYIIRAVKSP